MEIKKEDLEETEYFPHLGRTVYHHALSWVLWLLAGRWCNMVDLVKQVGHPAEKRKLGFFQWPPLQVLPQECWSRCPTQSHKNGRKGPRAGDWYAEMRDAERRISRVYHGPKLGYEVNSGNHLSGTIVGTQKNSLSSHQPKILTKILFCDLAHSNFLAKGMSCLGGVSMMLSLLIRILVWLGFPHEGHGRECKQEDSGLWHFDNNK